VRHTEETKRKISVKLKGRKKSKETIKKMCLAQSGEKNPAYGSKYWLGRKHTPKAKEKMRLAKLGKKRKPHSKKTKLKMSKAVTEEMREGRSKFQIKRLKNKDFPFKNTKPERFVQSALGVNNIEYETHIPFKVGNRWHEVDVFIKPNIIIEVDGNYWHNRPEQKIRDKRIDKSLKKQGYKVMRIWEDDIVKTKDSLMAMIYAIQALKVQQDWKPHRQLLSKCVMVDEDWKVTTFDDHVLAIEEDGYGNEYLFCRACQVND